MNDRRVLAAAYLFDWIAGDPEWLPHPVRLIGKGVEQGEQILRRPGQTPTAEFVAGGMLTFGLVAAVYCGTAKTIAWANRRSPALAFAVEILLGWTCLASRSLHNEATSVTSALERGDIPHARRRLARIVGRDTQHLNVQEISRAVIETVAESCSDGVIAPLFYMVIGGVPLAMSYKAINTLDSMIGHSDERYFYFGKIAARLDDLANFVPSRLTALGIATAASVLEDASPATALNIWLRDGAKHKSPNAGHPESAMAGALRTRLGGENFYAGEPVLVPLMGAEFPPPSLKKTKQAIQIAAGVSILGVVMAMLFARRR